MIGFHRLEKPLKNLRFILLITLIIKDLKVSQFIIISNNFKNFHNNFENLKLLNILVNFNYN